jgi:hypothetical protein
MKASRPSRRSRPTMSRALMLRSLMSKPWAFHTSTTPVGISATSWNQPVRSVVLRFSAMSLRKSSVMIWSERMMRPSGPSWKDGSTSWIAGWACLTSFTVFLYIGGL